MYAEKVGIHLMEKWRKEQLNDELMKRLKMEKITPNTMLKIFNPLIDKSAPT